MKPLCGVCEAPAPAVGHLQPEHQRVQLSEWPEQTVDWLLIPHGQRDLAVTVYSYCCIFEPQMNDRKKCNACGRNFFWKSCSVG